LDWVSLQRDPDSNELEILRTDFNAEDRGGAFRDFKDTADCLETLDLILTVDTSVSHVAGALGRLTWVLMPKCSDWRWLLDRPDSPWYPTMRLFRQNTDGDWNDPLNAVRQKLEDLLATRSG
jgi:ADP-heptose:LPS heptosyltransferase